MSLGTKSVIFGAHQFLLHPLIVAYCWAKLYGFPRDIRLWVAFFVHDLGYIGKTQMDDEEGERHPEWGARLMKRLFGAEWHDFVLYHSRFYAKRHGAHFSRLCVADKLAMAVTPAWLYLPMVRATGEVNEYMATYHSRTVSGQDKTERFSPGDEREWYAKLQSYMRSWVEEHRDMKPDTWTRRD